MSGSNSSDKSDQRAMPDDSRAMSDPKVMSDDLRAMSDESELMSPIDDELKR